MSNPPAPKDVKQHWNKAPAIWFPWLGWAHCNADHCKRAPILVRAEQKQAQSPYCACEQVD